MRRAPSQAGPQQNMHTPFIRRFYACRTEAPGPLRLTESAQTCIIPSSEPSQCMRPPHLTPTYLGTPSWQTLERKRVCFKLNASPAWNPQRREAIHDVASSLLEGPTPKHEQWSGSKANPFGRPLYSLFCGNARFRKIASATDLSCKGISSDFAGSAGSCGWSVNLTHKRNRFLFIAFQVPI